MLLKLIQRFHDYSQHAGSDTYGLQLLNPLLQKFQGPMLFTTSALRPIIINLIINDIIINQRKVVVELGSGISSLILAQAIKSYNIDCALYSVEQDHNWIEFLREKAIAEGLLEYLHFIHAPVDPAVEHSWYNEQVLGERLATVGKVDSLIVDGPLAYWKNTKKSRGHALDFFYPRLNDQCFVLLDDVDRLNERRFMWKWSRKYGLKFNLAFATCAYAIRGGSFNVLPLK
jgi:hypothetical protein